MGSDHSNLNEIKYLDPSRGLESALKTLFLGLKTKEPADLLWR